jgi:hypothetical protein
LANHAIIRSFQLLRRIFFLKATRSPAACTCHRPRLAIARSKERFCAGIDEPPALLQPHSSTISSASANPLCTAAPPWLLLC